MLMGVFLTLRPHEGLPIVALLISISFTLRGIQTLFYYFTMARYMVAGKRLLYRGIIFLDIAILTSEISNYSNLFIILYLAGLHAFSGVLYIAGAVQAKKSGSPLWKNRIAEGLTSIIMVGAVLIGGLPLHSIRIVVYIYGAGLIYSGLVRIVSAFRRTSIVYIQ